MIVDTHSHLNLKAYDTDRDEVIKRTQEHGIVCIDVGVDFETSQNAIKLAEGNKNIYASIGVHPTDTNEEFDYNKYKELAQSGKKIVAIGEVGLDYYYKPKGTAKKEQFKQKQKEIFMQQLNLAQELNLPVITHTRMAFEDTINILRNCKLCGVIHCFVGTVAEMQEYLDLGFYIGLNGIIYKFDMTEVIKNCPLDRILTETDCPYLSPPQVGAQRNEPIFVKHIIRKIADIKGLSFDDIALATSQNAQNLFAIK